MSIKNRSHVTSFAIVALSVACATTSADVGIAPGDPGAADTEQTSVDFKRPRESQAWAVRGEDLPEAERAAALQPSSDQVDVKNPRNRHAGPDHLQPVSVCLGIPDTTAELMETPEGAMLTFKTDAANADALRSRLEEVAETYNVKRAASGPTSAKARASRSEDDFRARATFQATGDGALLLFVPVRAADVDLVRRDAQARLSEMQSC